MARITCILFASALVAFIGLASVAHERPNAFGTLVCVGAHGRLTSGDDIKDFKGCHMPRTLLTVMIKGY